MSVQPMVTQSALAPYVSPTGLVIPNNYAPPFIGADGKMKLDPVTASKLMACNNYYVKQEASLLEAVTGGCCEMKNVYKIYDADQKVPLFIAKEDSSTFARCCCAPHHQLRVKFQHSNAEMRFVPEAPALMTMERDGGCCNANKCKLLGCCVCCEFCKDGSTLYAGDASQELGLNDQNLKIASSKVGKLGGVFHPVLQVMEDGPALEHKTPLIKFKGPTFFGGWSEMCCDVTFNGLTPDAKLGFDGPDVMETQRAQIVKRKPDSFGTAIKEMCTDADNFTLKIADPTMTPEQRGALLSNLMLLDYMFFERDMDKCSCDLVTQSMTCTFCFMYCCGFLYPCQLTLSFSGSSPADS